MLEPQHMIDSTPIDVLPSAEGEILLLPWREPIFPASVMSLVQFAPAETAPSHPFEDWVVSINQQFEPEPNPPSLLLLAAPRNEFEQCCPPEQGAHGAPYLTADEINDILNQMGETGEKRD